jgi:NADH dehydrogenase FAD-containing subunit
MSGVVGFFNSIFHFFTAYYFHDPRPDPSLKSLPMKNILILGGSYGGISTAHRILKQASTTAPLKITLVSPNTDIYWNMAAPRAAVGVYDDDKVFRPIAPGFTHYGNTFEFIVGTAESLDVQAKTVGLAGGQTLEYDFLILATGSRTKEVTPFKGLGSTKETKEALHTFREKVKESEMIVIVGGGPTGIEFAGELASEYGMKKQVHLVSLHHLEYHS